MGVRLLFHARVPSAHKLREQVYASIESIGATKIGKSWRATTTSLVSQKGDGRQLTEALRDGGPQTLYVTTFTDSDRLFMACGDGIVHADNGFLNVIKRMNMFQTKLTMMMDGQKYSAGDWILRVAAVTVGSMPAKGIFLEVEYLPCNSAAECAELVGDFIKALTPAGCGVELSMLPFDAAVATARTGPEMTAQLYLDLFRLYNPSDTRHA